VAILGSGFGASRGQSTVFLSGIPMIIHSWSDTSITATVPPGATTGPLVVYLTSTLTPSNVVRFQVTTEPLPSGWLDEDVGAVVFGVNTTSGGVGILSGTATYANGTFTVNGAGPQISGTADTFNFAYQQLSGNGSIVARVVSVS